MGMETNLEVALFNLERLALSQIVSVVAEREWGIKADQPKILLKLTKSGTNTLSTRTRMYFLKKRVHSAPTISPNKMRVVTLCKAHPGLFLRISIETVNVPLPLVPWPRVST